MGIVKTLSLISIFSIFLQLLYFFFLDYFYKSLHIHQYLGISCGTIVHSALWLYQSSRFVVYFLFFQRLVSIIKASLYQFNACTVKLSYVWLIMVYIITFIYGVLFGDGEYSQVYEECIGIFPWWYTMVYALFDILMCTIIQIMFARKLLYLSITLFDNTKSNPTMPVLYRSTLLTFISIFTNELTLILTAIFAFPSLWIAINSFIDCWCIILMFAVHAKCYQIIKCSNLEKCITTQCLYCYACDFCCKIQDRRTFDDIEQNNEQKQVDDDAQNVSNLPVNPNRPELQLQVRTTTAPPVIMHDPPNKGMDADDHEDDFVATSVGSASPVDGQSNIVAVDKDDVEEIVEEDDDCQYDVNDLGCMDDMDYLYSTPL